MIDSPPANAGAVGSVPDPGRCHMPRRLSLSATATEPGF